MKYHIRSLDSSFYTHGHTHMYALLYNKQLQRLQF